jgi:hypothetical protein
MESRKISENFSEITENIREYVLLKLDILKLTLTEKLARLASSLVIMLIFFILFLFISLFISLAFIFWFRDHAGPAYIGALIVAGFYLLVGCLIYLMRYTLFINPLVTQLSQILLEEEKDEDEN